MVDWTKTFKAEYDFGRKFLAKESNFAEDWQPLVRKLHQLMSDEGFDAGRAQALSDLRKKVKQGESTLLGHKTVTEDKGILRAVGGWTDAADGALDSRTKSRAATLKLLRHVYLLNKSGNRKVWLLSLPQDFHDWPTDDLHARAATEIAARQLLRSDNELFSDEDKKNLASATQHALAWCQKAGIVLANAANGISGKPGEKNVAAVNLVKRWFGDPGASVVDLAGFIATLSTGFKAIIAMLNKGHFVLTDWVPLRTASVQNDVDYLYSEAFTFRSRAEGMDTVYIERSFFGHDAGGVVHGHKNWVRILVHELTHLVCGTDDVNIGRARYAHYGIGPHGGFPGSAAVRNADSWAFFAADCAGVLTEGERNHALRII
ncbi:M35 family metallo-endopeptidase [Paucibacter sp. B51]|uniref:M35 family metallo-endopeptidase n=1 Tax=Paucibacter sp. B51 TaxID=2993315 RepID=UPI0022EBAD61|nr:M35 family metallo-endopeptidase [Paucibacter sp. B51]